MVEVENQPRFEKRLRKIRDAALKDKVKKQIRRIISDPEVGKPMRNARMGTREVYVGPLRLSYIYREEEDRLIFLDLYHKDEQ